MTSSPWVLCGSLIFYPISCSTCQSQENHSSSFCQSPNHPMSLPKQSFYFPHSYRLILLPCSSFFSSWLAYSEANYSWAIQFSSSKNRIFSHFSCGNWKWTSKYCNFRRKSSRWSQINCCWFHVPGHRDNSDFPPFTPQIIRISSEALFQCFPSPFSTSLSPPSWNCLRNHLKSSPCWGPPHSVPSIDFSLSSLPSTLWTLFWLPCRSHECRRYPIVSVY